MKNRMLKFIVFFSASLFCFIPSRAQDNGLTLEGVVSDTTGKGIDLAYVVINNSISALTDEEGKFVVKNLPAGQYDYYVSCLGYEEQRGKFQLQPGNIRLRITLKNLALALQEVTVTAQQTVLGSRSIIGQEAVRHIQPKSVADMLQLLPGSLTQNPTLNNLGQAHIREIDGDDNNALGTAVILDGMPLSNDGNMQALSPTRNGAVSSDNADGMSDQTTAGRGIDLRTVGADNIESIEVIRGIPSVEYGNLTSGVVVVKTKAGETPWELKFKADPFSKLVFAGKGFRLKKGGAVNWGLDWSQSYEDTRRHYLGYERVTVSGAYSKIFNPEGRYPVSFNMRASFYSNVNNRKTDPQMTEMQLTFKNKNIGGRLAFNGQSGVVNINIDVRPEENTVFTYNLSSPTTLTSNQFITYKKSDEDSTAIAATHKIAIPESTETDIRLNFNLDITPEATMKILMDPKAGDYIAVNGHGNIRANYYNKGAFNMYGTYTVDNGIYKLSLQDVIRKDFIFNPGGTITFSGNPANAALNLQAIYTVPSVSLNDLSTGSTFSQSNVRVNCIMNLTGKATSPTIGFDFDLPTVNEDEKQMVKSLISTEEEKNMQVIYLLGIGRFYTYDYQNTEQSQSSVAMKSLLSSTLSGQLNQMLSSIIGNNSNWNIGTNLSTGEQGWSDMDVEGLLSGRLLNNRLLINGNFGYRDNTTTTSNFIGDFDIQWLLTKNGNVSLKAYSKTNDRYFTKSTLTTQGIGLILKRDFTRFSDLFRFLRPARKALRNDTTTTR